MSQKYLNNTVKSIPNSLLWEFFDLANSTEGAISLSVGEPDFDTPWHICEEGIYSIEKGKTFYTPSRGLLALREEACKYYERKLNAPGYTAENCLITVGGSEAIDLAMRSIINPGDEVILLDPGYIAYEPAVVLSQGVPVYIHLQESNGFKITYDDLKKVITDKTKMILVNYPNNPTGGIMTKEDYEKIIPLLKEHNIVIVADEIYAELLYGHEPYSLASNLDIRDQLIVINGFSKAYSMTGWRLGYVLADKDIVTSMNNIHQYNIMSPSTISQYAGIEALKNGDGDIEKFRTAFEGRRNFVVKQLNNIGLHTPMPEGAFYVFPNITCTGMSSYDFCVALLKEQKVAVIPGTAFGPSGEGYVRISYAYSIDELKTSLSRIETFIKQHKSK